MTLDEAQRLTTRSGKTLGSSKDRNRTSGALDEMKLLAARSQRRSGVHSKRQRPDSPQPGLFATRGFPKTGFVFGAVKGTERQHDFWGANDWENRR
jgi:hypothetical protein